MLTIVIIAGIVIAAVVLFFVGRGRIRAGGGRGLKHRFGPEYDRAVADHDGDTKAAEQELGERVKQHGSLDEQPLSPEARALVHTEVAHDWLDLPDDAIANRLGDALLSPMASPQMAM